MTGAQLDHTADIVTDVLTFWLGTPDDPEWGEFKDIWFRAATPEFDAEIRDRFLDAHERAAAGDLDHLKDTPEGCLALLILLDQFPRNMFRGTARAFATDPNALEIAKHAAAKGFDDNVMPVHRTFLYLPFEHSENLADQEAGIRLMSKVGRDRAIEAAIEHRDIIVRFGRFPHRNAVLGRESTPEELDFLNNGGQTFGQVSGPAKSPETA